MSRLYSVINIVLLFLFFGRGGGDGASGVPCWLRKLCQWDPELLVVPPTLNQLVGGHQTHRAHPSKKLKALAQGLQVYLLTTIVQKTGMAVFCTIMYLFNFDKSVGEWHGWQLPYSGQKTYLYSDEFWVFFFSVDT